MTDCQDCAKARAGTWGGYSMYCQSCAARAIAKSPVAWEALSGQGSGDRGSLSVMVDRLMEGMPRGDAVRMVREWFKSESAIRAAGKLG